MKPDTQERLQYRCIKTVFVEEHGSERVYFRYGKVYDRVYPEIWLCPDPDAKICLNDEDGDQNHYMDAKWLNEHFEKV